MDNFDIEKIKELLKNFYYLTDIKICLYDEEGKEIYFYPEKLSSFCSILRKNSQMDDKCRNCDKYAISTCKKTHEQYSYTCHAGLKECFSPIIFQDKIIGYIVIGQIKDSSITFDEIIKKLPLDIDKKLLRENYKMLPSIKEEKINSAIKILDACASYEYLKRAIYNNNNKIDVLIANYIDSNLSLDLTVQEICSKFHLSHSEIYSIFSEYFNTSPAEYIKNRRLYKAKELLKTTTLNVNKIAKMVGISDYNYFSKVFKRAFNTTPLTYRKSQE